MRKSDSPMPEAAPAAFAPRHGWLLAGLVYILTTLTLCWPIFQGKFLGGPGSDQYVAGYAFRQFGAEMVKATGSIPLWNPYMFGGLPFVGAMHGDIFYPTAWLRLIMPVGTGMAAGFALHLVLAGIFAYAFLRALRLSWTAALVGGMAYQLTGILTSLASPGHDGKLFVSALTPLLFLALLRAIRDGQRRAYGLLALTVGLCLLSPHPQMSYYAFLAAGMWTLYLTFWLEDGPRGARWPRHLGFALGAVLLGVAVAAIQVVPFLDYLPYSARSVPHGPNSGWDYATSYAFPPIELFVTILPQFSGIREAYWGSNFVKSHSEYLGAIIVMLAAIGIFDRSRRRTVWALGAIAGLFLLVAFGGHTPFYRLWYEVMPAMKKVRAPGMAFFLVAFPVSVYAAFGVDRLLRRDVPPVRALIAAGVLGLVAVLGIGGVLQSLAESVADPRRAQTVAMNAQALTMGSLRLLLFVVAGAAAIWAMAAGRLRGAAAAAVLGVIVWGDLWSIDRHFYDFVATEHQLFGNDQITDFLNRQPKPYRVMDFPAQSALAAEQGVSWVYPGAMLMAHDVPNAFGYHGNELGSYDELWGGKNVYQNIVAGNLWDLFAIRYLILDPRVTAPPLYHRVVGPIQAASGDSGVLYQRDSAVAYARVIPGAAKLPEDQIIPTVLDGRFPLNRVVLYPESEAVAPMPLRGTLPEASGATAEVTAWSPGHMAITIHNPESRPTYLLVSENWYKAWDAVVDGKPVPTHRGDFALITVPLPPGAIHVALNFVSRAYETGRAVTLVALVFTALLLAWPRRRPPAQPAEA